VTARTTTSSTLPGSSLQRGLTLVELMITVAVLAILTALATPSFSSLIQSSRLTTTANELLTTLQLARSEAVRRNVRVVVCASSNGSSCSGSSTWSAGWIAFKDSDSDAAVDTGETVLASAAGTDPLQVRASANVGSAVTFRADGIAYRSNGALLAGRLAVCATTNDPAENVRDVVIASGSRITISRRNANGNCSTPDN